MYKEKVINAITGEESWRDYTKEEIAVMVKWENELKELLEEKNKNESLKTSATAKLAALGLTEEEIAAL